jgi:hypothetical protein
MEEKETIINDLIELGHIKDELWSYHPNNPDRLDVEMCYDEIVNQINSLTKVLNNLK